MDRRRFLLLSLATGGSLTIGRGALVPAFAAPAEPGASPFGPLLDPDADGLRLPAGFTSRVIEQFGQPIGPSAELAMPVLTGVDHVSTASSCPPPWVRCRSTPRCPAWRSTRQWTACTATPSGGSLGG